MDLKPVKPSFIVVTVTNEDRFAWIGHIVFDFLLHARLTTDPSRLVEAALLASCNQPSAGEVRLKAL